MEEKIQTVKVKNIEIGKGRPKICVSIQGATKEEIVEELQWIRKIPCDLIEWRSDSFETIQMDLEEILNDFEKIVGDKPLIFTYRTLKEGGFGKEEVDVCRQLGLRAIDTGKIDLLDVEYSMNKRNRNELIQHAHSSNIKVIISSHDFEKTPEVDKMVEKMCHMQETGADLTKQAVMPHSKEDVLNLLLATEKMNRLYARRPLITMSMSDEGIVSRYCGGLFGSAVTFASGVQASAPGQPKVDELQTVFPIFYKSI